MSQKQIRHMFDYISNLDTPKINLNEENILNYDKSNSNEKKNEKTNNYNVIYDITMDIINSRNNYYLNNISLN